MYGYFDESGHESKSWVVIAGFFGTEDQWGAFVPEWRNGLGRQRKSLHMNDLRWKKDSTRQLLERLGPIPKSCGLKPAIGGVRVSDYEDLVVGTPVEKAIKGYAASLNPLVMGVLSQVPNDERIEFVFEEQHEYADAVHQTMSFFSRSEEEYARTKDGLPKVAKWGFVPKHTTLMTDPADYLAFALKAQKEAPKSTKAEWCLPILIAGDGLGVGELLSRDEIRYRITETHRLFRFDRLVRMFSP
jgi:hypothetical protein